MTNNSQSANGMFSHKDYMEGKVNHQDYYMQFKDAVKMYVDTFPLSRLVKAYKTNEHLNNIPIEEWDRIADACKSRIAAINNTLGNGPVWSINTGICAAKAYAIHRIRTESAVDTTK